MDGITYARLSDRGVLRITGDDRVTFLQGLISNDVNRIDGSTALYAALLTPQGKFLHDFIIVAETADAEAPWLLEGERDRLADLMKRLKLFKLRAKVSLEDVSDQYDVFVLSSGAADKLALGPETGSASCVTDGVTYRDPRLSALGARAILKSGTTPSDLNGEISETEQRDYDALRIRLGVPDGSRDMVIEKAILLESGFDELNGVDWNKGCYMGQELTARTKYRGLVKKRLVPVEIEGGAPEPGTAIAAGGKDVGEIRSSAGDHALALLRLEALSADALEAGGKNVTPKKPDWAKF